MRNWIQPEINNGILWCRSMSFGRVPWWSIKNYCSIFIFKTRYQHSANWRCRKSLFLFCFIRVINKIKWLHFPNLPNFQVMPNKIALRISRRSFVPRVLGALMMTGRSNWLKNQLQFTFQIENTDLASPSSASLWLRIANIETFWWNLRIILCGNYVE